MKDIVVNHRAELVQLCERYQVARLELFGSAAGASFDPEGSGLDFLVEFADLTPAGFSDAYFGLLASLEDLFGRQVDLVVFSAVRNPYFRMAIDATRVELYAA